MILRSATVLDLAPLADLFKRQAERQRDIAVCLELTGYADWKQYAGARLGRPDAAVLVAEVDRSIVGFIDVRIVQRGGTQPLSRSAPFFRRQNNPVPPPRVTGFIDEIYVAPEFRRLGIGTALLSQSMDWFREHNVTEVEGAIGARNQEFLDFAKHQGFEVQRVLMVKNI